MTAPLRSRFPAFFPIFQSKAPAGAGSGLRTASILLLLALSSPARATDVFTCFYDILHDTNAGDHPVVLTSSGSKVPIQRAFEKEGLFYSDIARWYDRIGEAGKRDLRDRLRAELAGTKPAKLIAWLEKYPTKYVTTASKIRPKDWVKLSPTQRLEALLKPDNPFEWITEKGREDLFYDEILPYDDLEKSGRTPDYMTVVSDLGGSYEIKSDGAVADRVTYVRQRAETEKHLEGRVGHQHKIHGWPTDPARRAEIAPKYIEALDAGTWMLYWRQVRRDPFASDPEESSGILFHPFLGIYNRSALDRLHQALVRGDALRFSNFHRMIAARRVKPNPGQESDGLPAIPDWELRSGNKGARRDFTEGWIEARITSGDYSGLRDYRSYEFDASAPIARLAGRWLNADQLSALEEMEQGWPWMRYSPDSRSFNHFRNRVLAPLLPWGNRLNLGMKAKVLEEEQKKYAQALAEIASAYHSGPRTRASDEMLRNRIEKAQYEFADRVRLDEDLEHYLAPKPSAMPDIRVASHGDIDINRDVPLGIEYSFRFPSKPRSPEEARDAIHAAAQAFQRALGGKGELEELSSEGAHGHGLSIRYRITDAEGKKWRVEWDGIQRDYDTQGHAMNIHGGHIEVPSPRFTPEDPSDIVKLYQAAREQNLYPKRSAGGAHVNFGLAPLFNLPPKVGAGKLRNFIAAFENEREMISFLWQNPHRLRVAMPVELSASFRRQLNDFKGDWKELATLLYRYRYFNPYIGRKPAYVQNNLTGMITHVVPESYKQPIDIRKVTEKSWFPSFNGKAADRAELRLVDAPPDEYLAALQIKYFRALLDHSLNSATPIQLNPLYDRTDPARWREDPPAFFAAANEHLRRLGLDPKEFRPLLVQALDQQQQALSWYRRRAVAIREGEAVPEKPVYLKILEGEKVKGQFTPYRRFGKPGGPDPLPPEWSGRPEPDATPPHRPLIPGLNDS